MLANKFFYLIFSVTGYRKLKFGINEVIRSWVDDAEKIYQTEFYNSIIFIYPFFLNPIRGIKYILHCFKTYKYPVIIGIPYSFRKMLTILTADGAKFDIAVLSFEHAAMIKHVQHFQSFDIVYTSDEYLVNAHVLHSRLIAQGKKVINKAHGIGYYSPYVAYSEMHMYNDNQVNHYKLKNPLIKYFLLEEYRVEKIEFTSGKPPAIVFIDHGELTKFNLHYEEDLQYDTLMKLAEVSKKLNVELYIKFSPQTLAPAQAKFFKKYSDYKICSDVKQMGQNA